MPHGRSDTSSGDADLSSGCKQVAIVRPDLRFANIQSSRQMNCIAGTQRNIFREASDQSHCRPQQRVADGYEVPEIVLDMASENIHQFTTLLYGTRTSRT